MSEAGGVSLYLCIALALLAAAWDIRSRRIPNLLCAAIALAAIASAFFSGGFQSLGPNALHALVALLAGMGLFAIGFIGAGDAKMYSSVAFAIAPSDALTMLGWTSLTGLGLLVCMAITRRALGKPLREDGKSFTVPYAVPIALGLVLTVSL